MRTKLPLLIYGAGGSGRETAWLAEDCWEGGSDHVPVAFIDDAVGADGGAIRGMPLLNLEEAAKRFPNASFTTAVGNPALRAKLTEKAKQFGLVEHSLIHPTVIRSRHVRFGAGVVVCAGSTLTTDIEVGKGVQININCSVSHDCVLGDYATLAPGVHLCGNVHVGRGAYIGAGVVVKNGTPDRPLVIGPGTVVGAGACVTKSWEAGLTVVGVPAAILRQRSCNAT